MFVLLTFAGVLLASGTKVADEHEKRSVSSSNTVASVYIYPGNKAGSKSAAVANCTRVEFSGCNHCSNDRIAHNNLAAPSSFTCQDTSMTLSGCLHGTGRRRNGCNAFQGMSTDTEMYAMMPAGFAGQCNGGVADGSWTWTFASQPIYKIQFQMRGRYQSHRRVRIHCGAQSKEVIYDDGGATSSSQAEILERVHEVQFDASCSQITYEVLEIYCESGNSNSGCYPAAWMDAGWRRAEWFGLNHFAVCSGPRPSPPVASASASPGVVGDPHLTNLHGEKFDIHDGTHRLVHYPRGVPESEALLVVEARAVDMGSKSDCYSVYLDSVKMFGKWVGEEISISASKAPSASNAGVVVSFAQTQTDWLALASTPHAKLPLNGTMPITATTSMRKAFGEDAMGGEEITFEVGVKRPVLVQVWSSHGKNTLTNNEDVRYLNLQVKNLPKNSGGIIGLDGYSRPTTSRCELVQEERDLMDFVKDETADVFLERRANVRLHWTASATLVED